MLDPEPGIPDMPRFEFDNGIVHITVQFQQPPLDRVLLNEGLQDRLDTFPRWLEVEKLGLKDLDTVIGLGTAYCYRDVDHRLASVAGVLEDITRLATVAGVLANLSKTLHAIERGDIGPGPPARARAAEESDWEEDSESELHERGSEDECKHKNTGGPQARNTSQPDSEGNSKNQNAGHNTSTEGKESI
ncbi:hypothetical protein MIND_00001800 [Mycena indigotica]|uniref:Uncharacterized protein n=1 Tax=Mycena indigotica TaxID=2126181 RepID=A0A8H6WFL8_9AGAR|nr:uncharacterized protein MIND_00001800 [Mycena indigotica]KAF7314881.1 hypothetical protein MIND_00001800 [Mycena indigotica]